MSQRDSAAVHVHPRRVDAELSHDALRVTSDNQKQMVTGQVTVIENGAVIDQLRPARWFFNKHEDEPTTEVAIRRAPAEDLYVVLASYDASTQTATYAVTINPLVNWIWIGFGVIALGTGLALLPETAFTFAASKVPAAVPATTSLLLLLMIVATPVRAQDSQTVQAVQRSALERRLEGEIVCTCGCRRSLANCGMLLFVLLLISRVRLEARRSELEGLFLALED